MDLRFWISQAFGIVALILICISYQYNNKTKFLAFQIIANTFYAASFLTLNVLVGGINTIISLVRVAVLFFYEKNNKKPPLFLYIAFCLGYIGSCLLCFQTPLDFMAIISYEMFNMAMFAENITLTRWMMVLPNFIIMLYNIFLMTYTNALLDGIEVVVLIVAIIRFREKNKLKKLKYLI